MVVFIMFPPAITTSSISRDQLIKKSCNHWNYGGSVKAIQEMDTAEPRPADAAGTDKQNGTWTGK